MAVNIEKRADPTKKERLVASKKAWNKTVKLLIAKLIAFKRSVNGAGDKDAMLPEIDLKDPFPVEFHTYLSSIVDDYDKVIKGADFVMDLQDNFSATRRKSRRELSDIVASIDNHDQLIVEASWWGSRAWAWFALYKLGKDARRIRLGMLGVIHQSIRTLNTIEYNFTTRGPGSDIRAIVGFTKFINLYIGGYLSYLEQLKQIDSKGLEDREPLQLEQAKDQPKSEAIELDEDIISGAPPDEGISISTINNQVIGGILKQRVERISGSNYDSNQKTDIEVQLSRLEMALAEKLSDEDVKDIYENLIKHLEMAEGHPDVKKADTKEEEYRKVAQKVLQRWWNRNMLGSSQTEKLKEQIANEIRDVVSLFKELMDYIESLDRSTSDIENKTNEVSIQLKSIAGLTVILADDYRMAWRMEQDPKKRPARLEESITSKLKKLMGAL